MKNIIILFFIIALFVSCKNSKDKEINKPKKNTIWSVNIDIWGAPWDDAFYVEINNTRDSVSVKQLISVDDTIKNITTHKVKKITSFRITESQKDSIYNITKRFFDCLHFPESEEGRVMDGPKLSIELYKNNVALQCKFYNLTDIKKASPEIAELIEFINSKLKKEDHIY